MVAMDLAPSKTESLGILPNIHPYTSIRPTAEGPETESMLSEQINEKPPKGGMCPLKSALPTLYIVADALHTTIYGARGANLNHFFEVVNQTLTFTPTACEHPV
jgi:hypothetical protein